MNKDDALKPSRMSERQFVDAFGSVYEHSPWVARDAFRLGITDAHDSVSGLSSLMSSAVARAPYENKLELLRAHPDLAGRLARRGEIAAASVAEQSGAGLDQCSPAEFSRFRDLNRRYKAKFGFPFIIAVRDHTRADILRIFEQRLEHGLEEEFAEALAQVDRIAALRLGLILAE